MAKDVYYVGSPFEAKYGFSKAVKHNGTIYVSGSSGYNYTTNTLSDDATEQLQQAFENIVEALEHFGSDLSDLLQVQLFYSSGEVFEEVADAMAEIIRPSGTTLFAIRADLPLPEFKVELLVVAAARD